MEDTTTFSEKTFSKKCRIFKLMGIGGNTEAKIQCFSHWDEGLPHEYLPASSNPHFFPKKNQPLDVSYTHEGTPRTLEEYMTNYQVAGLMVLRDDEIIYEDYRYDLNSESRFHLWSATKSFTSTIVGMGLYDGEIPSLDIITKDYAPQFEGFAYGDVSLRHLLMMSSGVNFFHFEGTPDRTDMYKEIWRKGRKLDDFSAELGFRVPAGTDFNYLATDTHVISAILRGVYNKPFHEIASEKLWERLGMAGSAFWSKNAPDGHAFGHACLCPRLSEFVHLGSLYINDGVWKGKRLLPEGWVHDSGTPRAPFQEPKPGVCGYGYQFWIPPGSKGEFMALGAFGQILYIDIERKVAVAQFAGQSQGDHDSEDHEPYIAMRAIVDAVHK